MPSSSKLMRAVVCAQDGMRLECALPVPKPAAGEVLLRVRVAGICDTDLQLMRGYMGFRGVLGHEFVAIDPAGRRVTAEINNGCGACRFCINTTGDDPTAGARHCPNRTVMGIFNHDGAMADFVTAGTRNVHVIPDDIEDRAAVFIEPLAAALHAASQVRHLAGAPCAVLGDGKLGILCAWAFRDAGFPTTLVGKHPEKLALAGDGVETRLLAELDSKRSLWPLLVDATGAPTGLETALRLVEPLGTIILKTTVAAQHRVDLAPIVINEIQLMGSRCGPFAPAIAALGALRFPVQSLIQAEFSLDDAAAAFDAAARPGARKILIHT